MAKSTHFKQYDKRWGKSRYPSWGRGIYRLCGCGPTTIAIILSTILSWITPKIVGDWISKLKKGATRGGATYAGAVASAFQHWGFKVKFHAKMSQLFAEIYKNEQNGISTYGVISVYGKKNGVTWTGGGIETGHIIPVTGLKKVGNDWLLYIKDPGLRGNTGWYSYNKHLKGHCKWCLTCYYPIKAEKPTEPESPKPQLAEAEEEKYDGELPILPTVLERVAVALAWPFGTPIEEYKYAGGRPTKAYAEALDQAYPNRSRWGIKPRFGSSCDVFVGVCIIIAGLVSKFPRGLREQKKVIGKYFGRVKSKAGKSVEIKGGDIGLRSNHIVIYVHLLGELLVANAHFKTGGGTYGIIEKFVRLSKIYRPKYKPSYLVLGDTFTGVIVLQKFLKHFGYYTGRIDCDFGKLTDKAVRAYQKARNLKEDGEVGVKTLAVMAGDCK